MSLGKDADAFPNFILRGSRIISIREVCCDRLRSDARQILLYLFEYPAACSLVRNCGGAPCCKQTGHPRCRRMKAISQDVIDEIQDELEGVKKHNDALIVFERHGVRAYSQALALLGYKVKWSGLDPDNAEIPKE